MSKLSTKDRILNAAIDLLETSGIRALTQPAVAKLVGIPQGQLTYHFQKRADLILAVTQSSLDRVAEYLWQNHPELTSKSFEKLLGFILEIVKSKTRMRALLGLVVEADDSAEIREKLMNQGAKVRSLIATGLRIGEDSPEVSVAHAAILGFGVMFFLQENKEKRALLDKHFKEAWKILEAHIRANETPKTRKGRKS